MAVTFLTNEDKEELQTSIDNAGLSVTEKSLILTLFTNTAYTGDMSAIYSQLEKLWSGSGDNPGADGGEEPEEPHTHSYTSSVTTAATCDTAGVRTYTCSCGHSYTEAIPATGHTYVDGTCTNCGAADPDYEEPESAEPVYQLAEETTFDGTTSIDTGYALFDTDRDWTICVDVTFNDYGGNVFELPYSGHSAQTPAVGLNRYAGGYIRLLLYGLTNQIPNAASVKLVITRKAGMVNTKYATAHYATENTVTTLTCKANREFIAIPDVTLKVGGFKGTIRDLKIYEQILGETEIADYLGVSA